jgi:hypothetical protein
LLVVSFAADGGGGYLAFPPPNLQVHTQRLLNLYACRRLQQRQWLLAVVYNNGNSYLDFRCLDLHLISMLTYFLVQRAVRHLPCI